MATGSTSKPTPDRSHPRATVRDAKGVCALYRLLDLGPQRRKRREYLHGGTAAALTAVGSAQRALSDMPPAKVCLSSGSTGYGALRCAFEAHWLHKASLGERGGEALYRPAVHWSTRTVR